jgi:hypothetical protein
MENLQGLAVAILFLIGKRIKLSDANYPNTNTREFEIFCILIYSEKEFKIFSFKFTFKF